MEILGVPLHALIVHIAIGLGCIAFAMDWTVLLKSNFSHWQAKTFHLHAYAVGAAHAARLSGEARPLAMADSTMQHASLGTWYALLTMTVFAIRLVMIYRPVVGPFSVMITTPLTTRQQFTITLAHTLTIVVLVAAGHSGGALVYGN